MPCAGGYTHHRLDRERQKQEDYRKRQAYAADKRWHSHGNATASPRDGPGISQNDAFRFQSSFSSSPSEVRETHTREPETIQERASAFVEWYTEAHEKHIGVGYIPQARRDYEAALSLCQAFTDQQVRDGALVWLGSDSKWASNGTRTIWKYATEAPNCVLLASKVRA